MTPCGRVCCLCTFNGGLACRHRFVSPHEGGDAPVASPLVCVSPSPTLNYRLSTRQLRSGEIGCMCCARPCVRVCACSGRAACAVSHMAPQQCVCAPRLIALPMAAEPACASCVSLEPCTVCCLVLGNAPAPACTCVCVCVANARSQHAQRSILLFIDTRSHPRRGIAAEASTVPTHPPDLCRAPPLITKQPHSCSPPPCRRWKRWKAAF